MIWNSGDIVTEERYNRIKTKLGFLPTSTIVQYDTQTQKLTTTMEKLLQFAREGRIVYFIKNGYIYYLVGFATIEGTPLAKFQNHSQDADYYADSIDGIHMGKYNPPK